jgi:hypothetical protein
MATPVKKDTKARNRTPARERYAVLTEWLNFVRGESCTLPGVPLRFTRTTAVNETIAAPVGVPSDLRKWAADYLRSVARATAEGLAGNTVVRPEIEVPLTPPARIMVMPDGTRVVLEAFSVQRSLIDSLSDLVTSPADLTRLRICPACDELFIAFNRMSLSCPPPKKCGQKLRSAKWYRTHHSKAQKEALARYFERRDQITEKRKTRKQK